LTGNRQEWWYFLQNKQKYVQQTEDEAAENIWQRFNTFQEKS